MTSIKDSLTRILWATDGSAASGAAAPLLRQLFSPDRTDLTILTVAPRSFASGARLDPALAQGVVRASRTAALASANEVASREAARVAEFQEKVHTLALWGGPISEILEAARRLGSDLIVLGAKGHTDLRLLFLGSVALGVVQHASLPVLVVRPSVTNLGRIVLAYDGSKPAQKAADWISARPNLRDCELTIATVIEPFIRPVGMPVQYRARAIEATIQINEDLRLRARRLNEQMAEQWAKVGWTVVPRIVTGTPAIEILRLAAEAKADLVVLGSRKPSALRSYLLGSTAERVLMHSPQSVLVVR